MSIKPIDMQAQVTRATDVSKSQVNADKFVQQEVFKHEMQKNADKKLTEVHQTNEIDKLVDENGHNKQGNENNHKHGHKNEEVIKKEAEELEEYSRQVTHRGTLFDFKA